MRAGFLFKEVKIGLRRNLTMTFAVVITVAISLTLLGIGLLANSQVRVMKDYWYDKIEVSVFLCGTLSESPSCASGPVSQEQRDQIKIDIEALPVVDTVYYASNRCLQSTTRNGRYEISRCFILLNPITIFVRRNNLGNCWLGLFNRTFISI